MQNKEIIEIYNSIIKQIQNKIGKKTNIVFPDGSSNVIIRDMDVSENMYKTIVKRRDVLLGGKV